MNSFFHSNTQDRPRPTWWLVAMLGGALALTACSKTEDETTMPPSDTAPPAETTPPPSEPATTPPPADPNAPPTTDPNAPPTTTPPPADGTTPPTTIRRRRLRVIPAAAAPRLRRNNGARYGSRREERAAFGPPSACPAAVMLRAPTIRRQHAWVYAGSVSTAMTPSGRARTTTGRPSRISRPSWPATSIWAIAACSSTCWTPSGAISRCSATA